MAGEWVGTTLGNVIELKRGYDLPQRERKPGSVPLVSSSGVTDHHAVAKVKGPGVVTGRYGTLGQVFFVAEDFWPLNTTLYVRDFKGNDPRFVSYFLTGLDYLAYSDKAAVPGLNRNHLHQATVLFPSDVREQRAIAHILGTLDDKIELNRRMSETLEAMARALFKSWFIDFDPVRAKCLRRGEVTSPLPKHIADLFPDRLVDSDLGEIPAGWGMGRLGDVLEQRMERCDASIETAARPYVPIDCISSKSLFLTEGKPGKEAQSSLTRFYKGDLLFGAMRPYFHKVCIAPFDGTTRTTAFVLFPRTRGDFAFATLLLHYADTIDYATRHSTGSTIPYAVWSNSLEDMPVVVPPSAVREVFDGIVRPVLDRIPEPYFENKTLAALRDTLLPRLISGELRVMNRERFVGPQP
jgi:type I restriction enzyme, S subunit